VRGEREDAELIIGRRDGMADDEPILLHEPDLMLAILRTARDRPASLDDAMAQLADLRTAAREPPMIPTSEVRSRLEQAALLLAGAGAIVQNGDRRFRTTALGKRLLEEHPDGVDQSVLHALPEFRAFVAAMNRRHTADDPRPDAFHAGERAFTEGRPNVDNPFDFDTVDHLAWDCGWSEARDQARPSRTRSQA
jgi:hypothetical protein